jgi:glycine cleavage system H protein
VESVKAASDVYSPITGEVVAGNSARASAPETINTDSYGGGWLMRVKPAASGPATELLTPAQYEKLQQEEGD